MAIDSTSQVANQAHTLALTREIQYGNLSGFVSVTYHSRETNDA